MMYKENGMELAKIIVQVHPQTPEANATYARFLTLDKKFKEAAEFFYKAAIKEKGNLAVWHDLLLTYNKLGRYDSIKKL